MWLNPFTQVKVGMRYFSISIVFHSATARRKWLYFYRTSLFLLITLVTSYFAGCMLHRIFQLFLLICDQIKNNSSDNEWALKGNCLALAEVWALLTSILVSYWVSPKSRLEAWGEIEPETSMKQWLQQHRPDKARVCRCLRLQTSGCHWLWRIWRLTLKT